MTSGRGHFPAGRSLRNLCKRKPTFLDYQNLSVDFQKTPPLISPSSFVLRWINRQTRDSDWRKALSTVSILVFRRQRRRDGPVHPSLVTVGSAVGYRLREDLSSERSGESRGRYRGSSQHFCSSCGSYFEEFFLPSFSLLFSESIETAPDRPSELLNLPRVLHLPPPRLPTRHPSTTQVVAERGQQQKTLVCTSVGTLEVDLSAPHIN